MVEMTYLDHNATTPTRPEVITAVGEVMALTGANPSSVHGYGRDARKRIEKARMVVAALVNASPDEVIFTGSGSEADNLADLLCLAMTIKRSFGAWMPLLTWCMMIGIKTFMVLVVVYTLGSGTCKTVLRKDVVASSILVAMF